MTTRAEMDAFLLGEGPLDGAWFNSAPGRKPYWWRTHLQTVRQTEGAAIAAALNAVAAGNLDFIATGTILIGSPSSEPAAYDIGDVRPDGHIVIAADALAASGTVWVTEETAGRAAAHGWERNGVRLEPTDLVQVQRSNPPPRIDRSVNGGLGTHHG